MSPTTFDFFGVGRKCSWLDVSGTIRNTVCVLKNMNEPWKRLRFGSRRGETANTWYRYWSPLAHSASFCSCDRKSYSSPAFPEEKMSQPGLIHNLRLQKGTRLKALGCLMHYKYSTCTDFTTGTCSAAIGPCSPCVQNGEINTSICLTHYWIGHRYTWMVFQLNLQCVNFPYGKRDHAGYL